MRFYEGNYRPHITVINANVGKTLLHKHFTNQLLQNHKKTMMDALIVSAREFWPHCLACKSGFMIFKDT